MVGDSGAATELGAVSDDDAARDARVRRHDAIPPDPDVVGDLHQVVDLGVLADDGVVVGAPVHRRIGPDRHRVLNDHPTELRDVDQPLWPDRRPESGLADPGSGENPDPIADQGESDGDVWADVAVAADGDAGPDHRVGADAGVATDLRPRPHDGARAQDHTGFEPGVGGDALPAALARAVQPLGGQRVRRVRVGHREHHAPFGRQRLGSRRQEARGRPYAGQGGRILAIGQERDAVGTGVRQHGHATHASPGPLRGQRSGAGQPGQLAERDRAQVFEEARIGHDQFSRRTRPARRPAPRSVSAARRRRPGCPADRGVHDRT